MNMFPIKFFCFFLVATISIAQDNSYKVRNIAIKENGKFREKITNKVITKNNTTGKSHINYFKIQLNEYKSIKIGFADYNKNAEHFDHLKDGITMIKANSKYFHTFKNSLSSCLFKDTIILKIDDEYFEFNFKDIKNKIVGFKSLSYSSKYDIYLGEYVDTAYPSKQKHYL